MTENTENWSVLFVYNFKIQYLYHLESLLSQALIKLKAESLTAAGERTVQGFACSGHAELQKKTKFQKYNYNTQVGAEILQDFVSSQDV